MARSLSKDPVVPKRNATTSPWSRTVGPYSSAALCLVRSTYPILESHWLNPGQRTTDRASFVGAYDLCLDLEQNALGRNLRFEKEREVVVNGCSR